MPLELTHGICLGVEPGPGNSRSRRETLQVATCLRQIRPHHGMEPDNCVSVHRDSTVYLLTSDGGEVLLRRGADHIQYNVHLVQVCGNTACYGYPHASKWLIPTYSVCRERLACWRIAQQKCSPQTTHQLQTQTETLSCPSEMEDETNMLTYWL